MLALEAVIGAESLERINRPLLLLGLKRGRLSLKILQEERCELDGLILNPRKNTVFILVILLFPFSSPGNNWDQFEFRSLCLLLCLHSLLITWHSSHSNALPELNCSRTGVHREAGRFPKASVSFSLHSSRINAER